MKEQLRNYSYQNFIWFFGYIV